jgi:hypothetical protein
MHTMIIENERDFFLNYGFYDLMGQPARLQWRQDRHSGFDVHVDLQADIFK